MHADRNLQRILVQGTPGDYSDAGGVRDRLVLIGPRDAPIERARFVPAPFGDQLRSGFERWVRWVNTPDRELPAVVQAALAHYQFIHIPREIYGVSTLPISVDPSNFVLVALASLFLCLLATVYPARQASREMPVEVFRS